MLFLTSLQALSIDATDYREINVNENSNRHCTENVKMSLLHVTISRLLFQRLS